MKTCYRCSKPATTREHVPPRCLFPEQKDSAGTDLRRNLITVPSCDEHNLRKSGDDEFLMATLTPVVGNNALAYRQATTKLSRAIALSRGRLLREVIHDPVASFAGQPAGPAMPILKGRINFSRFCKAIESIALGLYYHEQRASFVGECTVLPAFLSYDAFGSGGSRRAESTKWLARLLVESEARNWVWKGANPDVFAYQLAPPDHWSLIAVRMRFFEASDIYASLCPAGVIPPHRAKVTEV